MTDIRKIYAEVDGMYETLKEMRERLNPSTELGKTLTDLGFEYERNKVGRKLGAIMDRLTYDILPRLEQEKDETTVD